MSEAIAEAFKKDKCRDPCAMVIFGASGDLTCRKLVPAIYNLLLDDLLPKDFAIVGVARKPTELAEFLKTLKAGVEKFSRRQIDPDRWEWLASRMSYTHIHDDDPESYSRLAALLEEADEKHGCRGNRLFYLAIPPSAFGPTVRQLKENGLNKPGREGGWARLVVEKPIGRNLDTAVALNSVLNSAFDESDVFGIDHYLGKETVQNMLVFRFANAIFESLWNQKYVDYVQITVAESIGVGSRGGYYEEAGATRDMVQNHLMQLLCLTAMEPPVTLNADAIRDEKVKVVQALRPIQPEEIATSTVRAQYASGLAEGEKAIGYKEEDGVSEESRTETYVALQVMIDNWRWGGVPFYLRSGKRLKKRVTEIAMRFHDVPHRLFSHDPLAANTLAIEIQPNEGIELAFDAKVPGNEAKIRQVKLTFDYEKAFGGTPPEAYERLILDSLLGDGTLFIRRDEVESSWGFIDRLHEGWAREDKTVPLSEYAAGTWGPTEADLMLGKRGARWRKP